MKPAFEELPIGEYGDYRCPMTDAEMRYDDGGTNLHRVQYRCNAELFLTITSHYGLYETGPGSEDFGPTDWTTQGWQVECTNGHVLLRSAGEESAEPFRKDFLVAEKVKA